VKIILTKRQDEILRALVNRIIPEDDFPGGWEGGIGDYLAKQLEGDLAPLREVYALGLESLDAEARAVHGAAFDQLAPELSDALLMNVEAGNVSTVWTVEPAKFFNIAVEHCAEGYYSDPGNGGNRDGVAWKMIGFEVRG
jgi:gluconate 2-dehydrogenase subunit 3-like protein